VELIPELAAMARRNLERTGRSHNVLVVNADGSRGYAAGAPYDAISVAAAAPEVPPALLEQLKDPGRLTMPVGPSWDQELLVLHKAAGEVTSRVATYCRFVPLREGPLPALD
jgi:protein-L-isoaspartate(D-aspartate) O-methyltransferase